MLNLMKSRPKYIELERLEGARVGTWYTEEGFRAANAKLKQMAKSAPECGYDKVAYVVVYDDDQTVSGRIDLKRGQRVSIQESIRRLVRLTVAFGLRPFADAVEFFNTHEV